MFVCLVDKLSSNPTLCLIIKQVKLKHNNVFMSKLVNIRARITIYNTLYLYVYLSENLFI